ncbi:MAG: chorismate-binding protein, partial [Verrucomicrobiae bacterium]|nr:chorismate-binding protein [Verrucomicrobiae bacterium]
LMERLSEIGSIVRETRSVMDLGSLIHFLSRIRVKLNDPQPSLNDLIRLMHPTPALGAFPRGEGALRMLWEFREKLGAPPQFGAPFGVTWQGEFRSVVAIRNVSWSGSEMRLPSGCGIIRESRFDREWRELALKRNSVKALLGV